MMRYKDNRSSGHLWIGEIPSHWSITKIKRKCCLIGSGTTPTTSIDRYYDGDINWIQSGDLYKNFYINKTSKKVSIDAINECSALSIYLPPFIVIAMYGASIGNVAVSQIQACVNQACCSLIPNDDISLKYLYYWLVHCKDNFISQSAGGTQPNISQAKIREQLILCPPRDEQDQIVRFLDWKVSGINKLINIKHRQIERLKALKKTVVSHAVTRGLNPDVKIKNSGVNWIGDIPEHWGVLKLKRVTSLSNEKASKQDAIYIGMENVLSWKGSYDLNNQINPESVCSVFSKGNILFGKLRPYLAKCIISDFDGICSSEFLVLKNINCNKKYLLHYLLNPKFIDIVNSSTYGAKMPRANWNFIGNQSVTIPPIEEQQQIADYLDEQMQKIEAAIANKQKLIETLQELKTRLISDVVTGKIDVREIEIPDYEYVEEEMDEQLKSKE